LNMFFGPVVNAARGVTTQIQSAVFGFKSNFQMAINPQITKNYAARNLKRMNSLIISSSKLSYFLFLCMALPLCLEAEQILSLWLVDVPEHTVNFLRLVLFIMIIESWQLPLHTANLATGKIRIFQTIKGFALLSMLPISYIALKMGADSEIVFVIQILVTFGSLLVQLKLIQPLVGLSLRQYAKEVLLSALLVSILSAMIPILLYYMLPHNFASLLVNCVSSVLSVLLTVYLIGLNNAEKNMVNEKIKSIIGQILRRN
ncbi:MAG: MATE family efflux transporter, partial [Candidatus Pacebacteria bacterium]|nr:MATE family efflux transporter [Candidatus Paceibacterota bacterium]